MNKVLQKLRNYGLIPIVTLDKPENVRPLVKALLAARLPVLEITFRTKAAGEAIHIISKEFPDILIGAGTVLTIENAEKAIKAGAQFLLAPGFNPKVVDYCIENNITILPGVNSPTQIELGIEKGLDVFKFFPSGASGGIELIKSMGAPFPHIHFVATGGINNNNLASYMAFHGILACGGSWLAKETIISAGNFCEITDTVQTAIRLIHGFRIKSIEISGILVKDFKTIDSLFSGIFHQSIKKSANQINISDVLQFNSREKKDAPGIICLETTDCERALFYIKQHGYEVIDRKNEAGMKELWLSGYIENYRIKIMEKQKK